MGNGPTYENASIPNNAVAVTPNDSADLTKPAILSIGTGGDVTVDCLETGTNITFKNRQDGSELPVRVTRVYSTGTTASNILALY